MTKEVEEAEVEVKYVFPKTLGACVDRLYALEQKRAEAERATKVIKKEYDALEAHLFDTLPKDQLEGAMGKSAVAKITRTPVPTAEDWDAIRKYVVKTKSWDLIQRRLSVTACRERWDAKVGIPGVGTFTKIALSLTKKS